MRRWLLASVTLLLFGCAATPESTTELAVASANQTKATTKEIHAVNPARGMLAYRAGWGPSRVEWNKAVIASRRMSLSELAGQVLVASYTGTKAPVKLVRKLHLGGVIVMRENVRSGKQISITNRTLKRSIGRPLFIAVDEEGGPVQRLPGVPLPSLMAYGAAQNQSITQAAAEFNGRRLRNLGFTVNFAPVADVTIGPADAIIKTRSVGSNPILVSNHVVATVAGLLNAGVVPVVKHFPGHGSLTVDSHVGLPTQARPMSWVRQRDLPPFVAAIKGGVPAIMLGHINLRAVAPGIPASHSRAVITGLLRQQLGFQGLVVTDSLVMGGAQAGSRQPAVAALKSGADVVLMPPNPAATHAQVVRAVRNGELPLRRLQQAVARQLALLAHQQAIPASQGDLGAPLSKIGLQAITSYGGPCRGRLVPRSVRLQGPVAAAQPLARALRSEGVKIGKGPLVLLTTSGSSAPTSDVLVALDSPYVLTGSRARVKLATFSSSGDSMRALARVLTGRVSASGRSPVKVSGVPRQGCSG
jgi:beta-N-acetylhexosaminidase